MTIQFQQSCPPLSPSLLHKNQISKKKNSEISQKKDFLDFNKFLDFFDKIMQISHFFAKIILILKDLTFKYKGAIIAL